MRPTSPEQLPVSGRSSPHRLGCALPWSRHAASLGEGGDPGADPDGRLLDLSDARDEEDRLVRILRIGREATILEPGIALGHVHLEGDRLRGWRRLGQRSGGAVTRSVNQMSDDARRSIRITRQRKGRYEATNDRGGSLVFSSDRDEAFTPVELLLVSIAGCTAADVDFIVSKRAEPVRFEVSMTADKVRDDAGNRLVNLTVSFDVQFPDGEPGDAARDALPMAVERSHDWLCTVGRTVELGTPVRVEH